MLTKQQLIDFETDIAKLYDEGKINGPIHLHDSNETKLIKIFKEIYKDGDWIVSTHRNHFHWLLSGRDPDILKRQIIEGNSMHVSDDKFLTSAIVAGGPPIALGLAMAQKLNGSSNKTLCFIGDAAYACGITKECIQYAQGHNLPIVFIVEDNKKCVNADTATVWGKEKTNKVIKYKYNRRYGHAGSKIYRMF